MRRVDSEELFVDGPAGRLEARLEQPSSGAPRAAAVLCHPHPLHGGTMRNTVVHRTLRGLTAAGLAVVRFNFRGVEASEGEHDGIGGEVRDAAAVLDWLERRYPELELWGAGFSFGARTIADLARSDGRLRRLVFVAMPVTAYPCDDLELIRQPALFIAGGADEYGTLADLEARLPAPPDSMDFVEIPGADHFFRHHSKELEHLVRDRAREALGVRP